jgi:hypothetical protein
MKPWKFSLNKHPTKWGKKNKERGPKFELETQKPKEGHKQAKE